MSLRNKTLLSLLLCFSVVFAGGAGFAWLAGQKQPPATREIFEKVYAVETYSIERADLQETVSAFGTARANREVTLAAEVAGEITEVLDGVTAAGSGLKVGRSIRAPEIRTDEDGRSQRLGGDLLLQIDPRTYAERVTQVESLLEEDEAELQRLAREQENINRLLAKANTDFENYQEELKRTEQLYKEGAVTPSELTKVRLELARYHDAVLKQENDLALIPLRIEQARKRKLSHQTDRQIALLDLERTHVYPPFPGIISETMVERGQYVRVGEPLVRITDRAWVEIPLSLTLDDYARIDALLQAGELPAVELAENEIDPPRWFGRLVRSAPEADQTTRTIMVYVVVDNGRQQSPLLPGTFVHARIAGPLLPETMVVPRDALINGRVFVATETKPSSPESADVGEAGLLPDPSKSPVQGRSGEADAAGGASKSPASGTTDPVFTVEERPVKLRRVLQSLAIVESGLQPGERVILTNLDVVHTGAKVRIETNYDLDEALERERTKVFRPRRKTESVRE